MSIRRIATIDPTTAATLLLSLPFSAWLTSIPINIVGLSNSHEMLQGGSWNTLACGPPTGSLEISEWFVPPSFALIYNGI